MEARDLIGQMRRAGMDLTVRDEDGALLVAPRESLTDELRAKVRRLKPAIVAVLIGNGADRSLLLWMRELAEALATTAPPGGWPRAWRVELRTHRSAAYRRVERAEAQCDALIDRLRVGEDVGIAWTQALREYEVTMLDMRAVLIKRAAEAERREARA